jgi:hypothetical protein
MRPQLSFVDRSAPDVISMLNETAEMDSEGVVLNARDSVALAANTGGEARYVQKVAATTTPHKHWRWAIALPQFHAYP